MFNMVSFSKDNIDISQNQDCLIVLLYDGAIEYMGRSIKALEKDNFEEKDNCINKAQYIINKLNEVLDMENGGELAINLRRLYCFINNQLTQANIECEPQRIRDSIRLMEKLNEKLKIIDGP
jgi:flagellar protein FliS